MQWLALTNWILVALLALPAARIAVVIPWLGVQAPVVLAGLVLVILFTITGAAELAWVFSAGVGFLAMMPMAAGARSLISDAPKGLQVSQSAQENVAMLVGGALPFLVTAILLSGLAVLDAVVGTAMAKAVAHGIAGDWSRDSPLFGTLAVISVLGVVVRPVLRVSFRDVRAASHRLRADFGHRYGHLTRIVQ